MLFRSKINNYGITANNLGFKSSTPGRKPVAQMIGEATDKKTAEPRYKEPPLALGIKKKHSPVSVREHLLEKVKPIFHLPRLRPTTIGNSLRRPTLRR